MRTGSLSGLLISVAVLLTAPIVAGQRTIDDPAGPGRARALLESAREALGGEEAFRKINSLSVKGKLNRYVKYISVKSPKNIEEVERTLSGSIEFNFSLPDKFRKRYSSQVLRGFKYSYSEIINGERAWRKPPLRAISSHSDSRVIDVDDFERTTELQARGARQQITLYTLGFLVQGIPTFPLQFNYTGRYQTVSGDADVISVEGPEDFQCFLLLDPRSGMPLSVVVAFIDSRQPTVLVESAVFLDRRIRAATFQRAREERRRRARPPQFNELHMQFSEYSPVAGISLPHRIKYVLNGELIEELVFKEFKINQKINPKRFQGEPEPVY